MQLILTVVLYLYALHTMPADIPSVLPERPPPSLLRTLEASETSELCDVCGFDTEPDNLIVYCESCNMGVHQTCYGISQVGQGSDNT